MDLFVKSWFRWLLCFVVVCFLQCSFALRPDRVKTKEEFTQIAVDMAYRAHVATIIQNGEAPAWFEQKNQKDKFVFADSIWEYISDVLAQNAVSTHDMNSIIHIRSNDYNKYCGANWNAFLFKNFINRALDSRTAIEKLNSSLITETAEFLCNNGLVSYREALFGTPGTDNKISNGAVRDINIYARALKLFDYLKKLRNILGGTSSDAAPGISGKFDEEKKCGTLTFNEFFPRSGGAICDERNKLRMTIGAGIPCSDPMICETEKGLIKLNSQMKVVATKELPENWNALPKFLTSRTLCFENGLFNSVNNYQTHLSHDPGFTTFDCVTAHSYHAVSPTTFSIDVPLSELQPDGIALDTNVTVFQISKRCFDDVSKDNDYKDNDYLDLRPQWVMLKYLPPELLGKGFTVSGKAECRIRIFSNNGKEDGDEITLSNDDLSLHNDAYDIKFDDNSIGYYSGTTASGDSLQIKSITKDNRNETRALLYDVVFTDWSYGGKALQEPKRQGLILFLSEADLRIWDDNFDYGLYFALKDLSIVKNNAKIRKLLGIG